jgi:hypothetical protein
VIGDSTMLNADVVSVPKYCCNLGQLHYNVKPTEVSGPNCHRSTKEGDLGPTRQT